MSDTASRHSIHSSQQSRTREIRSRKAYSHRSHSSRSSISKTSKGPGVALRGFIESQPQVVVQDEEGNNVTPVHLLTLKPAVLRQYTAFLNSDSAATATQVDPLEMYERGSVASAGRSFLGSAASSRSFSSTNDTFSMVDGETGEYSSPRPEATASSAEAEPSTDAAAATPSRSDLPATIETTAPATTLSSASAPPFTEAELDQPVSLLLEETFTIWLLELSPTCVEKGAPEAAEVIERNQFIEDQERRRLGNDNYVARGTQTFNYAPRHKEAQATPPKMRDAEVIVSTWDIHDTYAEAEADQWRSQSGNAANVADGGVANGDAAASVTGRLAIQGKIRHEELDVEPGTWVDIGLGDAPPGEPASARKKKADQLLTRAAPNMMSALVVIERMITQNMYHERTLVYRDIKPALDESHLLGGAVATNDVAAPRTGTATSRSSPRKSTPVGKSVYRMGTPGTGDGNGTGPGLQRGPSLAELMETHAELTATSLSATPAAMLSQLRQRDAERAKKLAQSSANGSTASLVGSAISNGSAVTANETATTAPERPYLQFLWNFYCDLTARKSVTCMAFNPANPDLLVIGYGQLEFGQEEASGGFVLCWSIKNPEYPERIVKTPSGVTAVAFSNVHPNLLAVGMYAGTIAIYDLRRSEPGGTIRVPVLDSMESSGKHVTPVWGLQFVDRGEEKGETLVSTSTDGRVLQWSVKKGFEYAELMRLKRVTNTARLGATRQEAFITRTSGGLCLEFSPTDANIYMVGTEDGTIHRCSCSYNEQFLDSYFGHTEPVYRVRWSPFVHHAFLSCSADWSVRLWSTDEDSPLVSFASSANPSDVLDVCWSPKVSTMFACVTAALQIEVWDLSQSTLDPVITHTVNDKLTSVAFAPESPVVVAGDVTGCANVYKICNAPSTLQKGSEDDQANRLLKVMTSVKTLSAR